MTKPDTAAKLLEYVKKYIEKNSIHCSEDIYQSDVLQETYYEFVEKVCEIVGYKEIED